MTPYDASFFLSVPGKANRRRESKSVHMAAAASMISRDSDSSLTIARKTIERREQMYEYYHPVVNKSSEAMLDMIRDGACTIRDPRACFHPREMGADVACCIGIPISKEYFDALVWDRRIRNNTLVILADTEWNTYTLVHAVDSKKEEAMRDTKVDEMWMRLQACSPNGVDCTPDNDMLSLSYKFVQPSARSTAVYGSNSSGRALMGDEPEEIRTLTEEKFKRYIMKKKLEYECARMAITEGNTMAEVLPVGGFRERERERNSVRQKAVPFFIIEHAWNLPSTGHSDFRIPVSGANRLPTYNMPY